MEQPTDKPPTTQTPPTDDGVDRTLIRWMLSLTPEERLRVVQDHANAVRRVRDGRKSE